ncbi:lysophospholipid acyltransferase family protein [Candidatus Omnitrophota bacterium]
MYLLYKIGAFLTWILPLSVCYRLADRAGSIYYHCAKKDRQIVNNNLRVILSHTKAAGNVNQLSRSVFTNFARYLVDFFRTPKIDLNYVREHVKLDGLDNLDQARSLKKGVLLVGAHIGNWELGALALAILGYKIKIIAWTHKNKFVNDFFNRRRESKGVGVIPLGIALKSVFTALKNEENVAILGDVDYTQPASGMAVKLFGQMTIMPKGPALFSLRTGAPIVPAFLLREKGNNFRFIFGKPIVSQPTGNQDADLYALTQKLTEIIAGHIALDPGQWFMIKQRWEN